MFTVTGAEVTCKAFEAVEQADITTHTPAIDSGATVKADLMHVAIPPANHAARVECWGELVKVSLEPYVRRHRRGLGKTQGTVWGKNTLTSQSDLFVINRPPFGNNNTQG